MRCDGHQSSDTNVQLYDQPEFLPYLDLFAFYEVVGMKAECTSAENRDVLSQALYAGQCPGLPVGVGVIQTSQLVQFPIQVQGNTQGQMFSTYYAMSKDLKKQGAQFSIPTTKQYTNDNAGYVI